MNNTSERPQGDNVLEALYASRRARTESPRLASVNEQVATRAPRPEPLRPVVPLHEQVHNANPDSAQGGIDSGDAADPDDFNNDGMRRKVFAGVIGVAATIAVASVVALLLVNIFPKDRDADQALAAAAQQARQANEAPKVNDTAKAALSQPHAPVAGEKGSTPNNEQSERLLQQFMQWRQKSPSTDKP
jgi:hypothetical protein